MSNRSIDSKTKNIAEAHNHFTGFLASSAKSFRSPSRTLYRLSSKYC